MAAPFRQDDLLGILSPVTHGKENIRYAFEAQFMEVRTVYHATDVRVRELPVRIEKFLASPAMEQRV